MLRMTIVQLNDELQLMKKKVGIQTIENEVQMEKIEEMGHAQLQQSIGQINDQLEGLRSLDIGRAKNR